MTMPIGGIGYPDYFSAQAFPSAAGQPWLNQQTADDFGFAQNPVYNLGMNYNAGYGYPGMGMGMGGGYGMGMGMGMGMMPRYSQSYIDYVNMDYKDRLSYDHDYNQAAREFNFKEGRNAKQYSALADGETGNISMTCRALNAAIVDGDTDQVVGQFRRIVNSLKASPIYDKLKAEGAYTDEEIDLQLKDTAFRQFQAATGQDLTQLIDANCDSSIANGFFRTISLGNSQHYSKEEMISKLYEKPLPHSTNVKKMAGKTAGVLTYIGAGAALGSLAGPIGTGVGAVVGGAMGLFGACV